MKGLLSASLILLAASVISAMRGIENPAAAEPEVEEIQDDIRELHAAARVGNLEETKRLLEKGVSINVADEDGRIPLTIATLPSENQTPATIEVAEFLWNKHKEQFESPLSTKKEFMKILNRMDLPRDIINCIKNHVIVPNRNPYATMTFKEYHPIKVRRGDFFAAFESASQKCRTPLQESAEVGLINNVKALLEVGEFVDQDLWHRQQRPFALALQNGHVEVLKLLAEKGANIEAESGEYSTFMNDFTPLSAAAAEGQEDIVRMLVPLLKSEDGTIVGGTQALEYAMRNPEGESHPQIARFLIQQGVRDRRGLIPEAYAAANADDEHANEV